MTVYTDPIRRLLALAKNDGAAVKVTTERGPTVGRVVNIGRPRTVWLTDIEGEGTDAFIVIDDILEVERIEPEGRAA